MLFEDIPLDFQNQCRTQLEELFNNIEKKENKILSSRNTLYPENITTQHQKLKIGCNEHMNIMIELLFLLHIFHEYSEKKQFMYTISFGTMLGYLWNKSIILWDDDIDIVVPFSHFKNVEYLWNSSCDNEKPIWDNNWTYKNIKLNELELIILKLKKRNFYKLKLNINTIEKRNQYQKDIGGLDILNENEFHGTLTKLEKENILGIDDNYFIDNYFNFKIKVLKRSQSEQFCNNLYPRWKEMKHPNLF